MAGLYPIILCGGSGSRLWPASRRESPKQFQPVGGGQSASFLQATLQRHMVDGIDAPQIVTNQRYASLVRQQMSEIQCNGDVICEPLSRNTGPAVLAACLMLADKDPDAVAIVVPSDHAITGDMNGLFFRMRRAADEGRIVIFGIPPAYAETGYGYITDGGKFLNYDGLHRVDAFIEKPPADKATALIAGGAAYWASGLSMFRAATMIEEFQRFDPKTLDAVRAAVIDGQATPDGWLLNETPFGDATSAATEQIIFEHSSAVALAPADVDWNDVGSWAAMYDIGAADQNGNVTDGDVLALGTSNSLIRSQDRLVTVIGMDNLVVVDTPDALLVAPKSQSQQVKLAVNALEAGNRPEVRRHLDQHYSWGAKRKLTEGKEINVDVLEVKPGAHLSLRTNGLPTSVMPLSGQFGIALDGPTDALIMGERHPLAGSSRYVLSNRGDDMGKLMVLTAKQKATPARDLREANSA